jgi:hypothetical protein
LKIVEACQHREQAEVHRSHVERCDLGLEVRAGLQPFLDAHRRCAAGGDVDHDVARLLDAAQERRKRFRPLIGRAVDRIAGVQMYEGRAGRVRAERGLGDLVGGDRQVRRHARRVDRAGDRAGDHHLAAVGGGLDHSGTP